MCRLPRTLGGCPEPSHRSGPPGSASRLPRDVRSALLAIYRASHDGLPPPDRSRCGVPPSVIFHPARRRLWLEARDLAHNQQAKTETLMLRSRRSSDAASRRDSVKQFTIDRRTRVRGAGLSASSEVGIGSHGLAELRGVAGTPLLLFVASARTGCDRMLARPCGCRRGDLVGETISSRCAGSRAGRGSRVRLRCSAGCGSCQLIERPPREPGADAACSESPPIPTAILSIASYIHV